jgi:hypothetical protein
MGLHRVCETGETRSPQRPPEIIEGARKMHNDGALKKNAGTRKSEFMAKETAAAEWCQYHKIGNEQQ